MTPRLKALLWIGGAVLVVGVALNQREPERPKSTTTVQPASVQAAPPQEKLRPFLKVTIERLDYDTTGYMKVLGKAENTGSALAFSPTIKLRVTDATGKIVLAETSTWPAGQYLKPMAPGAAAAFEFITRVPGEPSNIRWSVWVAEYEHDVIKPK